jgi:hypothetical protein
MRIQSGKHAGELSEVVFLKLPDLVQWMIKKAPDNRLTADFKALKRLFDQKPLRYELCYGCQKVPVKATAYEQTSGLYFWCDRCNPYDSGARAGTLSTVNSFDSAMSHADFTCDGNRSVKRNLIRSLANAKGLPKRITENAALNFFASS